MLRGCQPLAITITISITITITITITMTMMTNHNDEMSCKYASRRSDHGHNKAVEESKKIT